MEPELNMLVVRTRAAARGSGLLSDEIMALDSLRPAGLYIVAAVTDSYAGLCPQTGPGTKTVILLKKGLFAETNGFFLEVNPEMGLGTIYQLVPVWDKHPRPHLELERAEVYFEEVAADCTLNLILAPDEGKHQWTGGYRLIDTDPPSESVQGLKHYYGVFVRNGFDLLKILPAVTKDLGYRDGEMDVFE